MAQTPTRPGFPYADAAFCAACLAIAAYAWMTYSYAWPTTAGEIRRSFVAFARSGAARTGACFFGDPGPYVAVRGTLYQAVADEDGSVHALFGPAGVAAILPPGTTIEIGVEHVYVGRMYNVFGIKRRNTAVGLDGRASRFTFASLVGLAVGTAGVCVFGLSLRRFVAGARRTRPQTRD
jgi:hypothetical protein